MKKEDLLIKDLTSSGEGVGDSELGIIFVDGALPKEVVNVQVLVSKRNYKKAKLLDIVKISKHRIDPPCMYFDRCGGCQLQHADKVMQAEVKQHRVIGEIKKIAKIEKPNVKRCFQIDTGYRYRNKLTFPLYFQNGKKQIGFFKKNSHELVDIDS